MTDEEIRRMNENLYQNGRYEQMVGQRKPIWRRDPEYARKAYWEGYWEAEAEIRVQREAERQDRDPGRDHPDAPC